MQRFPVKLEKAEKGKATLKGVCDHPVHLQGWLDAGYKVVEGQKAGTKAAVDSLGDMTDQALLELADKKGIASKGLDRGQLILKLRG